LIFIISFNFRISLKVQISIVVFFIFIFLYYFIVLFVSDNNVQKVGPDPNVQPVMYPQHQSIIQPDPEHKPRNIKHASLQFIQSKATIFVLLLTNPRIKPDPIKPSTCKHKRGRKNAQKHTAKYNKAAKKQQLTYITKNPRTKIHNNFRQQISKSQYTKTKTSKRHHHSSNRTRF